MSSFFFLLSLIGLGVLLLARRDLTVGQLRRVWRSVRWNQIEYEQAIAARDRLTSLQKQNTTEAYRQRRDLRGERLDLAMDVADVGVDYSLRLARCKEESWKVWYRCTLTTRVPPEFARGLRKGQRLRVTATIKDLYQASSESAVEVELHHVQVSNVAATEEARLLLVFA